MNQPVTTVAEAKAAFDAHYARLQSGQFEGSRAILAGRTAGLAWDAGLVKQAKAICDKEVAVIPGMPSLVEFRAKYEARLNEFGQFVTGAVHPESKKVNFEEPGTAFSNAAGSYAYAQDFLAKGTAALAGGEAKWATYWGVEVLKAAGLELAAAKVNQIVASGIPVVAQQNVQGM